MNFSSPSEPHEESSPRERRQPYKETFQGEGNIMPNHQVGLTSPHAQRDLEIRFK